MRISSLYLPIHFWQWGTIVLVQREKNYKKDRRKMSAFRMPAAVIDNGTG